MPFPLPFPYLFPNGTVSGNAATLESQAERLSSFADSEEHTGIYQGDIIVQSAIRAAIKDVRANPWLWKYIFPSLLTDPVTMTEYGPKLVARMIEWLIKTDFPVFVNTRLDPAKIPAITINLIDSQEVDNTLADINYQPSARPIEPTAPAALCSPFAPTSWDSTTGVMNIPDSVWSETYIFPDMLIRDKTGTSYRIQNVQEVGGAMALKLEPGTVADFSEAVITCKDPEQIVALESAQHRESYLIGCHVAGESWQLSALHSFMQFCLFRYRQSYLEARGFQVSAVTSTDFSKNQSFEMDNVWSRYISLNGKVRNCWPKAKETVIAGIDPALRVIGGEHLPPDMDPNEALWLGELDALDRRRR